MPRKAREKSSTKVYHVISRGNAKQDIFFDRQDYCKFLKEIKDFSIEKRKNYLQKLRGISGIYVLQIARITGFSRKMIDAVVNRERRRTKKEMCP